MDRLAILHKALISDENDSFLIHAIALEYIKIGDDKQSIVFFEKNLSVNKDYLPTYYAYGQLLEKLGDNSRARVIYAKGIALAASQSDYKTQGELETALWMMDDE